MLVLPAVVAVMTSEFCHATKRLPALSATIPSGPDSVRPGASALLEQQLDGPITVEMMPGLELGCRGATLRMRSLPPSAIYRLPSGPTASCRGPSSSAEVD